MNDILDRAIARAMRAWSPRLTNRSRRAIVGALIRNAMHAWRPPDAGEESRS